MELKEKEKIEIVREIYMMAYVELKRQISIQCINHANLLEAIWQQNNDLNEMNHCYLLEEEMKEHRQRMKELKNENNDLIKEIKVCCYIINFK